ncbi:hypothetical protein LguiB_020225 [Lonicera macranthoides]
MPDRYVEFEYRFGAKVSKVFAPLDRKKLQRLLVFDNKFFSSVLDLYSGCDPLSCICIFNNELSGQVPGSLWSFPRLQLLQLENNLFKGPISPPIFGGRGGNSLFTILNPAQKFRNNMPVTEMQKQILENLCDEILSSQYYFSKLTPLLG